MTDQAEKQPFWEQMGLPAPGTKISREAYDALPEVNFHMEYINGVVIYPNWNEETTSPAPAARHQMVVLNLGSLLRTHAREHGGHARIAPTDVDLGGRTVQPDVFWVAEDGACANTESAWRGPPDLVIEVLSPSTARYDRIDKFALYESQGVREYWMVDPRDDLLEVYSREGDTLRRNGAYSSDGQFESPVLGGMRIRVADVFEA